MPYSIECFLEIHKNMEEVLLENALYSLQTHDLHVLCIQWKSVLITVPV